MSEWQKDFVGLSQIPNFDKFNDAFYTEIQQLLTEMETLAIESPGEEWQPTRELNEPISIHEVYQATMKSKPGKALGVANEIL